MPGVYIAKPVSPIWQPGQAPAGCALYMPLCEGAGGVVRDLCRRGGKDGVFTGSPTWGRGLYGPQLGGFSTSNYVAIDPPSQIVGLTYPWWMATLAICPVSSTTSAVPFSAGGSATNNERCDICYNNNGAGDNAGSIVYFLRDDSNASGSSDGPTASVGCNDGLPHVAMIVSYSATDHRIYWDGVQRGATTTSETGKTFTFPRLTIGALRRNTIIQPFTGTVAVAACGFGSVPNARSLSDDCLSGRFSSVRPRRSFAAFPAASGPFPHHTRRLMNGGMLTMGRN